MMNVCAAVQQQRYNGRVTSISGVEERPVVQLGAPVQQKRCDRQVSVQRRPAKRGHRVLHPVIRREACRSLQVRPPGEQEADVQEAACCSRLAESRAQLASVHSEERVFVFQTAHQRVDETHDVRREEGAQSAATRPGGRKGRRQRPRITRPS